MNTEYRALLARAAGDSGVRVIVVTGAGRGFCAGADTRALEGHVERGGYDPGTGPGLDRPGYGVRPEFDAEFAYQFGIPKPIIAAVNGPAAGVGFALACYCDLRFAAAGAKLTTAHGRLGLPAEFGLSWLLPRLVGLTRAADLLLSSRVVLAEEAAEIGLVNRVIPGRRAPAPRCTSTRDSLATEISPASLAATKLQLYTDLHRDVATSARDADERLRTMMTRLRLRRRRGRPHRSPAPAVRRSTPVRPVERPVAVSDRVRTGTAGYGSGGAPDRPRALPHATRTPCTHGCGPRRPWRGTRSWASGRSPPTPRSPPSRATTPRSVPGAGILVEEIGTTYATPPTMMHADPPVHTRYRRLVQPAFKPSVVRALEPMVRARTAALVRRIESGQSTDVVSVLERAASRSRSSARSWACPTTNGSVATSGPRR